MRYTYEKINLPIEDLSIQLFQITNVDEVFDALLKADKNSVEVKDERIPYWTELWPAAIALSHYLVGIKEDLHEKNIVELAAGLGLPSIVAGYYSGKITISDYIEDSLIFAKKNYSLNHKVEANYKPIDWRQFMPFDSTEIILASDIAYENRYQKALTDKIHTWLEAGIEFIFTEPGRPTAKNFIEKIKKQKNLHAFKVIQVNWRGVIWKVNLLHFKKI
jgi:predicted nicotinamide N-methyase